MLDLMKTDSGRGFTQELGNLTKPNRRVTRLFSGIQPAWGSVPSRRTYVGKNELLVMAY